MDNFQRQKRDVGMRLATLLAAAILIPVMPNATWAVTITSDAIIDAASAFNKNRITVQEGVDGPTTVRLIEGARIGGFELEDSSHLILDGGEVTFLSRLSGSSTLTVLSGSIGCTSPVCAIIDSVADVVATGDSSIVIKGMSDGDAIFLLGGNSTLTIFGTNLSTEGFSGETLLQGTLLDGSDFIRVIRTSTNSRGSASIILIEVPEPMPLSLVFISIWLSLTACRLPRIRD